MMEQREKLIKLIGELQYLGGLECKLADHLISNGVVVLPRNASVIEWHEVKTRPLDEEEKEYYAEMDIEPEYMFVGRMPEDGQEILIATKWGVDKDICGKDEYGVGLEGMGDWDGVIAWAEMPKYMERTE